MNKYIRTALFCAAALALGMVGACSENTMEPQGASPTFDPAVAETAMMETADFTAYTGVIGGRNFYEIRVPANWNGELVLYAHGFVDPAEPIRLPDKDNIDDIRDPLVEQGFAFAACSFRENGVAVKDGAWSTRQVHQIFQSKVKEAPTYTWLMGQSLGALVAVELVETHPAEFDGVVTAAGMIGGTKAQIDYLADVRMLYDLFYAQQVFTPNSTPLPGSVHEAVEIADLNGQVVYPVVGAVTTYSDGLGMISRIIPLPGRNGNELVESLLVGLIFNYRGIADILERTGGACPVDNMDKVYTPRWPGALPQSVLDAVNAYVQRYDRSIPTDELFDRYYEPSGRLLVEMVTVHLAHDPYVPVHHEQLYAAKVAAMGHADLLEQRVLDGYGHTLEIPTAEILAAFTDMRAKVDRKSVV